MRRFLIMVLLGMAPAVMAETAAQAVFKSECQAVDPTTTGLRCETWRGVMHLHWVRGKKSMTPEQRRAADLAYAKITMRYFDMGLRHFDVTGDHFPPNAMNSCTMKPTRAIYCIPMKCQPGYKACEEVKR